MFIDALIIVAKLILALVGIAVLIMFAKAAIDIYKDTEYCTPGEHCWNCPYDCKGEKDE